MLWLRLPGEATACVACGGGVLRRLDVLRVPRIRGGAGIAFLTGCEACGLVFVDPMPDEEQLAAFYAPGGAWADERGRRVQEIADLHARRSAKNKPRRPRPMPRKRALLLQALEPYVPVLSPSPGARVLDFGCGDGKLLNTLQDAGWETYGIEPSTDVAFLRHRRLERAPADGSFDLVIVHHVLEHVANPLAILQQIAGALRDGGVLYAIVPRLDTLPVHGDYRYCINGRNHLVAFSEVCLQGLLARAGLAMAARVDSTEMDQAFTAGQPLRLRIIAHRTNTAIALPSRPLDAAARALNAYAARHGNRIERAAALLPLRLRAAWMLRAR